MASEGADESIGPVAGRPQSTRVFVAIKMASAIADELVKSAEELERYPVRLVAASDVHLTLVPPWNEVLIPDAVAKLRCVANESCDFTLEFRPIGYGPKPRRPRLLWAECSATPELTRLRSMLLVAFGQADERPFLPHVTIARLRGDGARIARKHPIDRGLLLAQPIHSVELMQSPPPGGSGYKLLASLRLGSNREISSGG